MSVVFLSPGGSYDPPEVKPEPTWEEGDKAIVTAPSTLPDVYGNCHGRWKDFIDRVRGAQVTLMKRITNSLIYDGIEYTEIGWTVDTEHFLPEDAAEHVSPWIAGNWITEVEKEKEDCCCPWIKVYRYGCKIHK